MWVLLLIGFHYHKGPEGMSIKEIAKMLIGEIDAIFFCFISKSLKISRFFGKQYFLPLKRVRKLLSSDDIGF